MGSEDWRVYALDDQDGRKAWARGLRSDDVPSSWESGPRSSRDPLASPRYYMVL